MAGRTKEAVLSIHEALDNLSMIAEINIDDPYRIGVLKNHKFVIQDEEHSYQTIDWLTPESGQEILDNVKVSFRAILAYLKGLYKDPDVDWKNPKTKKGLQAMMVLVGETANKLELLTKKIDAQLKENLTDTREYKQLQDFYLNSIAEKFDGSLEGDEAWEEEWMQNEDSLLLDTEKRGLKDFETIRRDREYELFYLKDTNGKSFFNQSLIRNIKLICDFDETIDVPLEDDPLLRVVTMKDRDLQGAAHQILLKMVPRMNEFYAHKIRLKKNTLIRSLHYAILALMLASNQKNLIQNTTNKNCLKYFQDFQFYLRRALQSAEYQKWMAYPPEKSDKVANHLLQFTHELCQAYFLRASAVRQEMLGYIHRLARKGEEVKKADDEKIFHAQSIWNRFLEDDEYIRTLLRCYPNGPLFKILDILRMKEEEKEAFEPLQQDNFPQKLFEIEIGKKKVGFLHVPGPTRQRQIDKAELSEEFRGFIRSYNKEKKPQKHLLINLQDRTSWKENARAGVLEKMQAEAEFNKNIDVLSLTKDTPFYYQTDEYLTTHDAKDFIAGFQEQIKSPEECGFFFSQKFDQKNIELFSSKLMKLIHKYFFEGKKELSRKERLDFIEIFYLFLTLKMVEVLGPDTVSFTCKDAIDTGAVMGAGFFAFAKALSKTKMGDADTEFLRWLIYAPALLIRERSVNTARLGRMLTALNTFEKEMKKGSAKILKDIGTLYEKDFFTKIKAQS